MASIYRSASAITPDIRPKPISSKFSSGKRSVTFGRLKTPTNNTMSNNNNNSATTAEEASRAQAAEERKERLRNYYKQYRSSPDQYPSYERLRFVKLPDSWLPEGLRTADSEAAGAGESPAEGQQLQHWPCLIYQNIAELVRDLSPTTSQKLKAKLIVEHRKSPNVVVARLIGWDGSSSSHDGDKGNNEKKGEEGREEDKETNPFAEPKLEMLRFPPNSTLEQHDESDEKKLLNFMEKQLDMEDICEQLIAAGKTNDSTVEDVNVARHAYMFRNAMDISLNCLALDVGDDPLPPREYDEFVFSTPKLSASGAAAAGQASESKKDSNSHKNNNLLDSGTKSHASDVAVGQLGEQSALKAKVRDRGDKKKRDEKVVTDLEKSEQPKPTASAPSNESDIPPLEEIIDPTDSWSEAWKKMRNSGWSWKVGSGLMTDYYYIKPGCKVKGGTKGQDYFECEEDARDFATKYYGWKGDEVVASSSEEEEEADEESVKVKSTVAVVTKKKKEASSSSSNNEKENQLNTTVGTKSRPSAGTQEVPRKFQPLAKSYSKKDKKSTSTSKKSSPGIAQAIVNSVNKKKQEKEEIEITPWKDVWDAMKRHGWGWRGGSGLMTDYYYIKPGCKIKGGTVNQDYFIRVEDVQQYARKVYKWGSVSHDVLMTTIKEYAKYAGEVVPPLSDGLEIAGNEPWRDAWEKLLKSGWTWRAGAGLMMDYYYIKPGCKAGKNGVKGQDYFVCQEDVQKFAKRNYGWCGDEMTEEDGVDENDEAVVDYDEGRKKRRSVGRMSGEDVQIQEKRQKVEQTKPVEKDLAAETEADEDDEKQLADDVQSEDESSGDEADDECDEEEDNQSTFSESGFQTKKLFLDECADLNVPPLEDTIDPTDSWSDAWKKMRNSGWSWKAGTGLMTDYYYIKPGCKVKGGMKGQDYFECEEDVKAFAMRNYDWRGEGDSSAEGSNNDRKRNNSNVDKRLATQEENKRQKVEKTLSKSVQNMHKSFKVKSVSKKEASSNAPTLTSSDKKALWQTMQKEGWRAISAGKYNKLHDWYYVRPNCDPGDSSSKLNEDYFLCEDDAIEFVNANMTAPKSIKKTASNKATDFLHTPADCRTKPQDPAKPLLSSPESDSSISSSDLYDWRNVWPLLKRAGWKSMKAGRYNPLHDYYYCRPNRLPGDSNSELGRHYFSSQCEVIDFVRELDEKECSNKLSRKSMGMMLSQFEEEAKAI